MVSTSTVGKLCRQFQKRLKSSTKGRNWNLSELSEVSEISEMLARALQIFLKFRPLIEGLGWIRPANFERCSYYGWKDNSI